MDLAPPMNFDIEDDHFSGIASRKTWAERNKTMRILFAGGSGKAGRHAVDYPIGKGQWVLNLDLTPLHHPDVDNRIADNTNAGPIFTTMACASTT